jgi:hypothetical protein
MKAGKRRQVSRRSYPLMGLYMFTKPHNDRYRYVIAVTFSRINDSSMRCYQSTVPVTRGRSGLLIASIARS